MSEILLEDAVLTVAQLINQGYLLSKVFNTKKPVIQKIYDFKKLPTAASKSGIYVYEISDVPFYQYSARKRNDRFIRVSVDMRFKSREYMLSNKAHIREILEANTTTISSLVLQDELNVTASRYNIPWNRMYEVGNGVDMSNRAKNLHRFIIDVELQELGHVRAT